MKDVITIGNVGTESQCRSNIWEMRMGYLKYKG